MFEKIFCPKTHPRLVFLLFSIWKKSDNPIDVYWRDRERRTQQTVYKSPEKNTEENNTTKLLTTKQSKTNIEMYSVLIQIEYISFLFGRVY